jgi:cytochrome c5
VRTLTALFAVAGLLAINESALAASDRLKDGREAYAATCASCHETGTGGAPQTRNIADWQDRSNLWEGVLFEHAEKGYSSMPAKGGNENASEYDVEAAAEYMLTITHPEMPHD